MKIVLVLSVLGALLAQASCSSVVSDVEEVISYLESVVATGDKALSIPVLDPLNIGDYGGSFSGSGLSVSGSVSDVKITGISGVDIESVTESGNKVVVRVSIPSLTAAGGYSAKGKIQESLVKLSLQRSGTFTLGATDITGTVTLDASDKSGALSVSSVDIDYDLSSLSITLSGLNSAVNKIISQVVKKFEKSDRSNIEAYLNELALQLCKEYVSKVQAAASSSSVSKAHHLITALRRFASNIEKHPIQSWSWSKH